MRGVGISEGKTSEASGKFTKELFKVLADDVMI